jgi:putative restriction endonuclease
MTIRVPNRSRHVEMGKLIFSHRWDSIYRDVPDRQYNFPSRSYLRAILSAVGDWAIYYEPGAGSRHYFAAVKIIGVRNDPEDPERRYADLDPTTYIEFDRAVPMVEGRRHYERGLRNVDGSTNMGAVQRAVRYISDDDFNSILAAGFAQIVHPAPGWEAEEHRVFGVADEAATWDERPIVERLVQRPFRDAAFRARVRSAYSNTCAITGLRLINGGGRPEVEAAHIRPIEMSGPDSVRNGLALSGTAHWMFDRGLISVSDDCRLIAAENALPDNVRRLIEPGRPLILPAEAALRPHPQFLRFHRETIFKG